MQTNTIKVLSLAVGTALVLSSCNGLGKMIKKQNLITYEVTPKPLEMHGDSVALAISGKYPAKLFAKKAVVTVTPVIKFTAGGEKALKPVTLVGEKATASGTKIMYTKGGTFSYNDKVAYEPGMKVAKVELRATGQVKSKSKEFKAVELGEGTVVSPLLVRNDEKAIFAKDNFVKVESANKTASVYYSLNQSSVRSEELKSAEMNTVRDFVNANINSRWYTFKGIEVSAYASPDGELTLNENLAKDRAKSGSQALMNEFKKNKNKENQFGKEAAQYNTVTTAEDWDGFKKLMEGSSLPDKDLVLRVLSMYTDPMQREKEIKNLANTYKEIAGQILPKLRRSVLTILVDKNSRTDDEISKLCASTPDSLNLEELLYGATLTEDLNIKTNVYKTAESKFGSDWRTSNNLGVTYLLSNKVDDAKAAFERANKASANNPVVMNNMGAVVAKSGDRRAAMSYYEKAKGAGPEVSYNTGIVLVRDGKYSEAVSSFGEYKGFNLALAQLLAGTPENVSTTIDASKEKEMAMSYYLKAVASARKGDAAGLGFLKTAIEKDGSLKTLAKEDCEFIKWRANGDFSSLTN